MVAKRAAGDSGIGVAKVWAAVGARLVAIFIWNLRSGLYYLWFLLDVTVANSASSGGMYRSGKGLSCGWSSSSRNIHLATFFHRCYSTRLDLRAIRIMLSQSSRALMAKREHGIYRSSSPRVRLVAILILKIFWMPLWDLRSGWYYLWFLPDMTMANSASGGMYRSGKGLSCGWS